MENLNVKKRIVIVDDEPVITQTLSNLLFLEGDFDVQTFNKPKEAVEYIRDNNTDLVISDFLMPEMNGIEFLSEVKNINSGITLILLTGYADKENAIKAINEVGIYRYIEKPWDNADLLLAVKNGLERAHLLESLEQKIEQLNVANKKLENYNAELEAAVNQRTKELQEANNELAKINGKLDAIISHCADSIITINKEGKLIQVNPAFVKLTSVEQEQLTGKNLELFFIQDSNESLAEKLNPRQDILIRDYKIINNKTEKAIPVEMSFAPILNEEELKFVGVIRDVTLQYEMERLRDDFIATLTHDLRTPLLAAIQTLKFFLDGSLGELSERQHILLDTMLTSNTDMLGLVNALLEVYKYEAGKLVLCSDNINLSELITHCAKEIELLAENKNLELIFNIDENVQVYADKQELRRVIANFLGNAINYTSENGKINLSLREKGDSVTVSVEDTGMGIPKEDIPKMFKRFSQGTNQKRSTSTGLGLYLSRQIIEAHGGKIWLESELGKGSKFSFSINKAKTKQDKDGLELNYAN